MRQTVLVRVNPRRDERRRKDAMVELTSIRGVTYEVLMRSGLANGRPASRYDRGMKERGAVTEDARPQVTADREVNSGVRLAWSNPTAIGGRTGKSALSHQPTGREGDRRSMGIAWEKDAPARARQFTGRERQNSTRMGGDPFPSCVADIVDEMPTRKGARPTLFLVCIDGVRI